MEQHVASNVRRMLGEVGETIRLPSAGQVSQTFEYKMCHDHCQMYTYSLLHLLMCQWPVYLQQRQALRGRSNELEDIRTSMSKDSGAQLQAEVKGLPTDERKKLLRSAGITLDIPPEKGLALKGDLAIPWNKLRTIRRYFVMS